MSRIGSRFAALAEKDRTALIPYVTAGDPHPDVTVPLMHDLVAAGADVIELGVPFSDPMADGPVIQLACERALAHGISLQDVLSTVRTFRERDTSTTVVLMGYLNPIEAMGAERFAKSAGDAGVDGVLTVDLPPEESHDLASELKHAGLDSIYLAAPTTTDARLAEIAKAATGFIYYVSLKGVTGSTALDIDALSENLTRVRRHTRLPLGVGFGIGTAAAAAAVARIADAVVVGSALVRKLGEHAAYPDRGRAEIVQLLSSMREAIDAL